MHWFTADPHYGHDRIIRFCDRPFPPKTDPGGHVISIEI